MSLPLSVSKRKEFLKVLKKVIIICLILGCSNGKSNYLLEEFTTDLISKVEDESQISQFKAMSLDSAVLKYATFESIFNEGVAKFWADSLNQMKFDSSLKSNGLHKFDSSLGFLIGGIVHKNLNKQPIDLDELKSFTDLVYIKQRILKQDGKDISSIDNNCFKKQLAVINNWLIDSLHRVSYIDADMLIDASNFECQNDVEFMKIYNETLLNYLLRLPNQIIELIEQGNYSDSVIDIICQTLQSPKHRGIDLEKIIIVVEREPDSKTKRKILNSLKNRFRKK